MKEWIIGILDQWKCNIRLIWNKWITATHGHIKIAKLVQSKNIWLQSFLIFGSPRKKIWAKLRKSLLKVKETSTLLAMLRLLDKCTEPKQEAEEFKTKSKKNVTLISLLRKNFHGHWSRTYVFGSDGERKRKSEIKRKKQWYDWRCTKRRLKKDIESSTCRYIQYILNTNLRNGIIYISRNFISTTLLQ